VKPALVGALGSSEVSFGRYADGGHDEERGEHHDIKRGASIV